MTGKILLVEDNKANMKLFCDLLESRGYEVTKAYDGESALHELLNSSFDALILDIGLPKLSGIELMEHLQNEGIKRPKTLIVSAFAMENEIMRAKMFGCEEYITKPIDIIKFLSIVEEVVKQVGE